MFHTCRAVLPAMLDAGHGLIVNVSSIAGVVGLKNRLAYCASKHGVVGLTRAIAADYAHLGIRCNAICPGTLDRMDPERSSRAIRRADAQQMEARQLDGRMGTPEEVAAGIAFLASDEARFVNGSAFMMDGGMSAGLIGVCEPSRFGCAPIGGMFDTLRVGCASQRARRSGLLGMLGIRCFDTAPLWVSARRNAVSVRS